MISVKFASLIAAAAFAAGSFFAPPVQQAIAAVIATDVQCTGCVGTSDMAGNAVTAAKIKDGEVKAAEIATDAVGASEIAGVAKLLFGECVPDSSEQSTTYMGAVGSGPIIGCSISGVDTDDVALAMLTEGNSCFDTAHTHTVTDKVYVTLLNECTSTESLGIGSSIAVVVFDKQ